MGKKYFSQKEIAIELNITKQQVYRCIKKHCFNEALKEVVNGNTVLKYDEATFYKIKSIIEGGGDSASRSTHEAPYEAHYEALVEALVKQLEEKDKQIEKLQQALDQEQKLHAMDKQRILELECKEEPEELKKKKWWQRKK